MSIGIKRKPGETWRECAIRYAKPYGLEADVAKAFDNNVRLGDTEGLAAFNACHMWDVLDFNPKEFPTHVPD